VGVTGEYDLEDVAKKNASQIRNMKMSDFILVYTANKGNKCIYIYQLVCKIQRMCRKELGKRETSLKTALLSYRST
jgi:hypothetical protein